jgi:glycogen operon protein
MIVAGDECLRTQCGNNNAYCHNNPITWFDWTLVKKNGAFARFCQALIAFRKRQPTVRRTKFLTGRALGPDLLPDVTWFGADGHSCDWNAANHSLVCLLGTSSVDDPAARPVLLLFHSGSQPRKFVLPELARLYPWRLLVNTAAASPNDIYPDADGPPPPADGILRLIHHSMMCFVASEDRRLVHRPAAARRKKIPRRQPHRTMKTKRRRASVARRSNVARRSAT